MIVLENLERRLSTFAIPVGIGGGEKQILGTVERVSSPTTRSGTTSLRTHERIYPTTLTLCAWNTKGSVSEPLPDSYAEAPEIAKALRTGKIRMSSVPEAAPAQPEETPASGEKE